MTSYCEPIPKPKKRKKKKRYHFKPEVRKHYCQVCKSTYMIDPPHHIKFKGMGGSSRKEINDPDNAITLCRSCHDKAHRQDRHEYLSPDDLREAKRKDEGRP